jgi:hypothetical protein
MLAGNDKDLRAKALDAANKPTPVSPAPKSEPSFTPSMPTTSGFPAPTSGGFGASFNSTPAPVAGFGGKLAPPEAPQPLL